MRLDHRHQRGFTLAEALIAAAVLAFAVAAIAQAVSAGQMQTYAALHDWRALSMAEVMMEEVLSKTYADPEGGAAIGPDAGEADRDAFDDVDDFDDYVEDQGATLADQVSQAYPQAFQTLRRSVRVDADTLVLGALPSQSGKTVAVTVADGTGRTWVLTRFVPEPAP